MPESVPCPTCRRPAKWEGNPYRPFCSDRCKVRDLGAWASEEYRIGGPPLTEDEDSAGDEGEDD
ncbi:MAG TPA: DNA gyrase inhibitor YacG [Terriglobales bacterium]|nr:DNA gyrase inhibitor YacG [Terriglobales bacterium]